MSADIAEIQTDEKPSYLPGDGTPGPGRPAGLQNRTTRLLKDAIMAAADIAGDRLTARDRAKLLKAEKAGLEPPDIPDAKGLTRYCLWIAEKHPKSYAVLMAKVLPLQVSGEFKVEQRDGLTLLMEAVNGRTRSKP
jgi:hypothetical protein